MREWWTLKLAKEADEAELASMLKMSKNMPITHLDLLVKVACKNSTKALCKCCMNRMLFCLIISFAHQDFQKQVTKTYDVLFFEFGFRLQL